MSFEIKIRHFNPRALGWFFLGIFCYLTLCHGYGDINSFDSFVAVQNKSLKGFVFKSSTGVTSYFRCYQECDENFFCASVNYYASTGLCELSYVTHLRRPDQMTDDPGASYMQNLNQNKDLTDAGGLVAHIPAQNCRDLFKNFPSFPSGNYWLDLNGIVESFYSYCDMDTDGGGWTLVWSFTFNNYADFQGGDNYVKPFPRNMYSSKEVLSESFTPPQSENDMNALDMVYWKYIGYEFLIKSTINNWVACQPDVGNLVTKTTGALNCRFVRQVVFEKPSCNDVPGKLTRPDCGFNLKGKATGSAMYFFDRCGNIHWPVHDPCGNNEANHKHGVPNPHSNLYIR